MYVLPREKLAFDSSHQYYVQNRSKLLNQSKRYRAAHKAIIARKAKMYNRKVDLGLVRPQKRIAIGHDYQFIRR